MNLGSLEAPAGSRKKRKRLGRGEGSGHGGTSTKGHKGQKARSGGYHKRAFEGGQNPLIRRVPKKGFVSLNQNGFNIVNVGDLNELPAQSVVDLIFLKEQGFVKQVREGLKILGNGDLKVPLKIKANRFSESAQKKIVAAGGSCEVIS